MFNLELKRISLRSIVLSAYPFVVFVFVLLSSTFALGDLVNPGAGFLRAMTQVLLYSLIYTGVVVLFTMLAAFIYNLLTSFGMKGIRFSLTEDEETALEETSQEEPAKAQETENK